jgi:beta-N-acetylhexosaminidase
LLLAASTQAREPYLGHYRPFDLVAFVLVWALGALAVARHRDVLLAALLVLAGAQVALCEGRFWRAWYAVRSAPRPEVQRLATHLVAGFRSWDDARHVALELGVGGLFLAGRNLKGHTAEDLADRIATLQRERAQRSMPPLIVAADQEGGIVASLSPPLPAQPPLAELVRAAKDAEQLARSVQAYAREQADGMRSLGVRLNLAPVLDINRDIFSTQDRFTRIYARAISSDPDVVAEVGVLYCLELERRGVRCTAKHFPGLGRVRGDTHLQDAALSAPPSELASSDWIPFRAALERTRAGLMIGHVRLTAIDSELPASLSPRVLSILRRDWRFAGVLITDDLSMAATRKSDVGLGPGAVLALANGVDLLLLSYDPDLVWPVLHALLMASPGELSPDVLTRSKTRLGHDLRSLVDTSSQ